MPLTCCANCHESPEDIPTEGSPGLSRTRLRCSSWFNRLGPGRALSSLLMRPFRTLLVFKLGALPSRGDEESDELSLVAVFDGIDLKSRAKSFRGDPCSPGSAVSRWISAMPSSRLGHASLHIRSSADRSPDSAGLAGRVVCEGSVRGRRRPDNRAGRRCRSGADAQGMAIFGGIVVAARADGATDTTWRH